MHPVGDLLKQTRVAKGLSLEQAAMTTRIRKNYLEALERGDRELLPSPVQGRGFLRLYAGYLGLPVEDLVADWEGRPRPVPVVPAPAAPKRRLVPEPPPVVLPSPEEEDIQYEAPADLPEDIFPEAGTLPPPSVSSDTILAEIGRVLRKQRERLGLSLDDIEKHTHIRLRYLVSLEAGRLDQLPSTVQCRGMLSNYAVFLNLDAEALLLRFAEALQTRRLERLPSQPESGQTTGGKSSPRGAKPVGSFRRFFTPDLAFGAGLILVLFLFIIWTVSRIGASGSASPQVTLPSVSEILLAPVSPTAAENASLPSPQVENQTPGVDNPTLPPADSSPQPGNPTSTLGSINSDPLQVYIIAKQRAFLRVTVDGVLRFNGRLIPGNAYPYSGVDRIDILIGNAAAVQIFFNQQELSDVTAAGESASFSFTQSGIQTPTALPTPTPTITPPVTATPTAGTPAPKSTITPFIP
jgi:cytoskeleton protein RodZ